MTEQSKNTNDIITVAVDDGYAQTKLVGECPETGKIKQTVIRSAIRAGKGGLGSISGGGLSSYVTEENERFTVSADIESESTQFDGFHTSTLNRVLVNHALLEAGYGGRKVNLVTGLPVADYFFDEERDQEHIEAKRANLRKGVSSGENKLMPVISDVKVGCQAVAAWFDYILDDDLEQKHDASGRIAIVDIGGRTTDIAVVIGGSAIDHSISGTENHGVLDVYKTLSKSIRKEYRIKEKFPMNQLDQAVRRGTIKLWAEEVDVKEKVREAVEEQERLIAREVERRLGSAANLSAVVFVGGGAELFKSISKHFRNGVTPEAPEFSNARGLFKFAKIRR